jgi:lipopolysaccharide export system ATP-binding protein
MSVLTTSNLKKKYRQRQVGNGVSVKVDSGEVVGLLGPNGAGKTTCFYLIVGLIPADNGQVVLDGQDVTSLPMHARARLGLGYLAQEPSVFRKLTVKQNVRAILELRGKLSKRQQKDTCNALLEELRIGHLKDSLAMALSGGERRRVEIARALAVEPRFILLDEPFAGVDPIAVMDIKNIVTHLCDRGIGVLITDHNVRETLDICDRAYIINEGRVMADGDPDSILANPEVRAVYLGEHFNM